MSSETAEQLREQRDYWRAQAEEANLNSAELEGECVGHIEANRKLAGYLACFIGLIHGGFMTISKNPSAVWYIIESAEEVLRNGYEETAQENHG